MSVLPHTRLFIGESRTVDVTGPHVQVLDTTSGEVLYSTTRLAEETQAAVTKSGPVRCAAVDVGFRHFVTSGEDKVLRLWDLEGLRVVNERELPKRPTSVAFSRDGQTIIVSDKFGDVFTYPFHFTPLTEKPKRDALSSHENPSGGQLILGHTSPLNAFLLTQDEQYIMTADRDEHIRVSWYPKGYVIERYCLGHLKFVSAIHIPKFDPERLISGGGDPVLKVWNWKEGKVVKNIPIAEAVEPYIVVRAYKKGRAWGGEDGEEGEGGDEESAGGPSKKRKRGRRRAKGKGNNETPEPEDGDDQSETQQQPQRQPETILAIRRIGSVETRDSGPFVLFSAVGATALFGVPYGAEGEDSRIVAIDFGRPVLEFVVAERGIIVLLDGRWEPSEIDLTPSGGSDQMAVCVRVENGGFVVCDEYGGLVGGLNGAALVEGSRDGLELYEDLSTMPKYTGTGPPKALTRKEMGKIYRREAAGEGDEPVSKRRR